MEAPKKDRRKLLSIFKQDNFDASLRLKMNRGSPKIYWTFICLVGFSILFFGGYATTLFPRSFVVDHCASTAEPNEHVCRGYHLLRFALLYTEDGVKQVKELSALLSAGVVALFTVALWATTDKLRKISNRQISAFEEIERAFVYHEFKIGTLVDHSRGMSAGYQIVSEWKNSGSTPAKQVFTHVSWDHFQHTLPPDFSFPDHFTNPNETKNTMSFIAPKSDISSDPINIASGVLDAARMGWIKIYVWGWVEYDDVFSGVPHRTEFCNEVICTGDPYAIPLDGVSHPLQLRIFPVHTGADAGCFRKARTVGDRDTPLS